MTPRKVTTYFDYRYRVKNRPLGRLVCSLVFLCLIGFSPPASTQSSDSPELNESVDSTEVALDDQAVAAPEHDIAMVFGKLDSLWTQLTDELPTGAIGDIHGILQQVSSLQREGGIAALPDYSRVLLREANTRKAKRDNEAARYLVRKALELSPSSPEVHFNAVSISGAIGERSAFRTLLKAISLVPSDPSMVARIVLHSLYPTAWAVTLGVFVAFLLYLFFWIVDVLRQAALFFPLSIRGIAAPFSVLGVTLLPLLVGPLVTVCVWGLLLWMLDRRRRWALLSIALVCSAWGVLSPVRERLALWVDSVGNQTLLSYNSGSFSGADRFRLEQLTKDTPSHAAWFSYGQLLRRYGDYPAAITALKRAEQLDPESAETLAERAVVFALMGDEDSAKKDLQSALQKGNESVELLYNYSRISADSLDTAGSREYLLQARSLAPDVVSALQAREEKLGAHHPAGYANVQIPFSNLLSSLWDDQYAPNAYLSSALLFGQSPFFAAWCGVAFLLLSVIPVGARGKRRLSPYFAGYQPSRIVLYLMRILPGGPWAMRQNPTVAAILFSVGAFFSLPLLGWPSDARWLMVLFPGWAPAYFTVLGSVTLVVVVIGFISSEE